MAKLGDITITKQTGTTLTLNTNGKYVATDVSFDIGVRSAVAAANTATADVNVEDVAGTSGGTNISGSIGTKSDSEPSSGFYICLNAQGSGSSKITTAGWIANGSLTPASTSVVKYFPVDSASIVQNAPTINTSTGLVTATTSITAGYTLSGTKSNTLQLSAQGAATIAPAETEKTAVAAGKYTTGLVKVGAIPSTYVGSAIPQNDSSDLTVNGPTVTAPAGYYAEDATNTIANGDYSPSVTSASISVAPTYTPATIGTITDIATTTRPSGTDGTNYWTITPRGSKTSGTAVSKATATITTPGYIEAGSKTTSSYTSKTITITENEGTESYIPKAVITGKSTNAAATITVAPGNVNVTRQNVPSGVINAADGNTTTTAPTSGVYVAVKATVDANNAGASAAISGSGTATVSTAGYAPSTLTGSISVSGSATAKTSAKESLTTYVPIATTNASVSGKTVSYGSGWITSGSKSVADGSARTPATTITANPTITIDSSGLITATTSASQSVTPVITSGYVTAGTAGTITVNGNKTLQLTTKAATTYTPSASNQTIASGTYLTGTQTIKGDANLIPSNIKNGVTIFGITGTHKGYTVTESTDVGGGTIVNITTEGGEADSLSWIGKNAELMQTFNAFTGTLATTTYQGWAASTTATTIQATQNFTTFTADMANYEYVILWKCTLDVNYNSGTPLQAIPKCTSFICTNALNRRPSNRTNIYLPSYNGAVVNSDTYWITEYYNTSSTLTAVYSTSYGFYFGAPTPAFSSTTANSTTVTVKTPTIIARCHTTYFDTARKEQIALTSPYTMQGYLYRISKEGTFRNGMLHALVDLHTNIT